uniref:Sperm associated antigen 7 n=1 Tax=Hucho hucho TaxID=62062 RepID=A0A4W5R7W0_9TELE
MEKLPTVGDKESRRRDRGISNINLWMRRRRVQDKGERLCLQSNRRGKQQKRYNSMGKIERSILHDVEFAPSDDELEAYRKGMQWDPQKEQAALEEETANKTQKRAGSPSSNYRDKYSHLISTSAARMHTSGQQKDTCSIEQAMNVIRAKKRQKTGAEDAGEGSSTTS